MRNALFLVFIGILLSGCASKYKVDSINTPTARLSPQSSFYVVLPKDGTYGTEVYRGSGLMTANASIAALARHANRMVQAEAVEDTNQALETAKQRGLTHVFEPTILHWEDRATEWSGKPDRITLKFTVYDTQTGQPIASTTSRASSKWATFGGDHPQDLVPVPTQQFVDTLF